MTRPRHQNKEIEQALQHAEDLGWRVEKASGSAKAWGRMFCPNADRSGCRMSVHSTPRVPEHHAAKLVKAVNNCSCPEGEDDDCT
ncbi:hypothetical protein B6V72_09565 [Thioclava sp. F34-6]|nr:hypothetical protein B6V72_09565 [Thioclava sp. F34-6]